MLRNTGAMIAVICAVGVTTLWTIGLLTVCGRTFNMVTVTLPSLIFILSLSSGIHISSRYLTHLLIEDSRYKALRTTLQEVFIPILLSSLTTSAGFASLMISDMQPVVDFGKFAAVGMILSLLFNIMIVPGMLLFLVRSNLDRKSWHYHWTSWIGVNMLNRRRYVLVASLLLLMVFAGISTRLRVESNVLKFFPKDAKITRDYDYIGSHLTGFYTIELDLTADAANGSRLFKEMSQLSETIETRPEAAKVLDYGKTATLFQDMTDSAFIRPPRSGEQNSFRSLSKHYMLKEDDKISMRISVLVRAMSSGEFYSLLEYIRQQAFETISMDTTTKITGVVPLLNAAQQTLINTQIQSLSIAAGVVMCLIGVFVGSFRAFIAAVLPNVLPIFGLFAIMAMLNIPLDAATVMIASVAIGIAVDDTIHFLSHYRLERASAQTTEEAVRITLNKIGRAITFTSVVATAGFMILCLAPFKPICYFGILASVTMVIAWVSDVFVLPACVSALGLWEKK
jgi:predicted RND superfamily exporter protein